MSIFSQRYTNIQNSILVSVWSWGDKRRHAKRVRESRDRRLRISFVRVLQCYNGDSTHKHVDRYDG